jgi:hypothetical protein
MTWMALLIFPAISDFIKFLMLIMYIIFMLCHCHHMSIIQLFKQHRISRSKVLILLYNIGLFLICFHSKKRINVNQEIVIGWILLKMKAPRFIARASRLKQAHISTPVSWVGCSCDGGDDFRRVSRKKRRWSSSSEVTSVTESASSESYELDAQPQPQLGWGPRLGSTPYSQFSE